jgi:hypothetical protein
MPVMRPNQLRLVRASACSVFSSAMRWASLAASGSGSSIGSS